MILKEKIPMFKWICKIKKFIVIGILTFSYSAVADKTSIQHPRPGQIVLKAGTCNDLKLQVSALQLWAKRFKEDTSISTKTQYNKIDPVINDGIPSCEIDIFNMLPQIIKEIYRKKPKSNGPNCFNAALVSNKILPSFRFTTEEEFSYWVGSPHCRERGPAEIKQPGDIIAIRKKEKISQEGAADQYKIEEIHAFTYITEDLSLSKNGFETNSFLSLFSKKDVFDHYEVPEQCQNEHKISENCSTYANVFTCKALEFPVGKLDKKNEGISKHHLNGTREFVCEIDCQIQKMIWDRRPSAYRGQSPYPSKNFFLSCLNSIKNLTNDQVKITSQEMSNEQLQMNNQSLSANEKNLLLAKITKLEEDKLLWKGLNENSLSSLIQLEMIPSYLFSAE